MTKKKKEDQAEETCTGQQTPPDAEQGTQPAPEAAAEKDAQAACKELNDKYIRVLAEYDNYRKRSQKERDGIYADAQAATVAQLLPVLDNLDLAESQNCTDAEYKKGVEMIAKQFREMLEKLGVQEIPAVGQPFDPNLHNAVLHVENDDLPENTVAMCMRKGYIMGERVIRHAMVQVAN